MTQRYPLVLNAGQKQQLQSGDSAYGSIPYGRRNALINGNFDVWQRGTSFVTPASNIFFADRWKSSFSGTFADTITQSTDVPTVAQSGMLSNFSFKMDCTTALASVAAGNFITIFHRIEGYNFAPLAQRSMTLSFWVKSTKTGVFCVAFRNSGFDRSYVAEYTVNVSDTWEKKTINILASPSAGTWDYQTGIGLEVAFVVAAGSSFQTTAGAWQSANVITTSNQVNGMDNTANNFLIAQVQLEQGDIATDFELTNFAEQLALCQRYYCKTFPYATVAAQNVNSLAGAIAIYTVTVNSGGAQWWFPVRMRAANTPTLYNPKATNANWWDNTNSASRASSIPSTANETNVAIIITSPAAAFAGNYIHADASAEI